MHTNTELWQKVIANDENTQLTVEYLRKNFLTPSETCSEQTAPDSKPEFFLPEHTFSPAEFATFFFNHIRTQAESILAAAQVVWDQEQQKAQKLNSKLSGKLPPGRPGDLATELSARQGPKACHSRPNSTPLQAASLPAAAPPALDIDTFPALGSSSAQSAKHGKVT